MSNRPNEITQLEKITKPTEVIISEDILDISVFYGLGSSLASVTTDQKHIPRKNKRKETTALSILRKESIQETINPRKISQGDYLMLPFKAIPQNVS